MQGMSSFLGCRPGRFWLVAGVVVVCPGIREWVWRVLWAWEVSAVFGVVNWIGPEGEYWGVRSPGILERDHHLVGHRLLACSIRHILASF